MITFKVFINLSMNLEKKFQINYLYHKIPQLILPNFQKILL